MAKTESTAVNSLIDLVQSNQAKPIVDPSDDLFAAPRPAMAMPSLRGAGQVAPLPRSRAPGGTAQLTLPEHRPAVRSTTAPPSRGTTIPPIPRTAPALPPRRPSVQAEGTPPPALQARPATPRPSVPALPPPTRASSPSPSAGTLTRASSPSPAQLYAKAQTGPVLATSLGAVAPQAYPVQHQARIDMTGDMVRGDDWFEASRAVEKFDDETYVGTSPHVLRDRRVETPLVKKLILPAIGFILVGAVIGGFIALDGSGKTKVVAKPPAAHVAPANQPSAQNAALAAGVAHATAAAAVVQPTRGVVQLADVRIDSMPAGATVTLVEQTSKGAKKSFLGTTPIETSLDASRTYEVVLALQGHPEQTAQLDPAHTPHLQVALGKAIKPAPARPEVARAGHSVRASAPRAVAAPKHHSAPKSEQLADPGFDSTPAPVETRADKPAAGGDGTLMISSKPPCEIEIDGKSTGLRTPQRAMPLSAGAHKITLVNSDANVNKTLMVQINAGQATKLVKDLTGN